MTVFVLTRTQLQAIELHVADAHFTGQHAAPYIGHHLYFVQAQGAVAFTHHHIMRQQHRRHAAPAAFKTANAQRHAQGFTRLALHFGAIFSNQWREFASQADVQRRQHQQQRTKT